MNPLTPSRGLLRRIFQLEAQLSSTNAATLSSPINAASRCSTRHLHTARRPQPSSKFYHHTPTPRFASTTTSPSESTSSESPLSTSQGLDITNHYTIFSQSTPQGPPPSGPFKIDLQALRREFLQLQSRYHPDKYPPGPEKSKAEALSARVNEAYKTLKDPLLRGTFLLHEYHGIDVLAEDGAGAVQDPQTLMEVMEVQERIEECESHEQLLGMQVENQGRIERCVRRMADAFEKGDVGLARDECVKLRYWYSVKQGMDEWEPGKEVRLIH